MGSMGSAEPTNFLDPIVEPLDFERFHWEYTNVEPLTWIPNKAPVLSRLGFAVTTLKINKQMNEQNC